jgi:acetyl-CoA carboxylase biotin carboxylase subunit
MKTTVPFHQKLMKNEDFKNGKFHTGFLSTFEIEDTQS